MSGTKRQRLACSRCTRRKVKCDKAHPCHNCVRAGVECIHDDADPGPPRKRVADDEKLTQLARYEDLMRQHNIDFSAAATPWQSQPIAQEPYTKPSPNDDGHVHAPYNAPNASKDLSWCAWSGLNLELKYPPIKRFTPKGDPISLFEQQPFSFLLTASPEFKTHHPEPRLIYQLWQIFVERVNPLIKIIHVPTLQQQIMDASWNPANASPSLAAILFAMYTLGVAAMSAHECFNSMGEARDSLLLRYRGAAMQALVAADFMTTSNLEVLQALVLLIFADPDSELTSTLSALAIRVGNKMGLDRGHEKNNGVSFFQQEMRVRLWWALSGLDARCRRNFTRRQKATPPPDFGDVRLPLNVNDADLHADMKEPPVEHNTPTEVRLVLMKYQLSGRLVTSPMAAAVFENLLQDRERTPKSMEAADKAIDDIAAIYRDKYLRYSDTSIPLHQLTYAAATLAISCWRFMARHPRLRAPPGTRDVYMAQGEIDNLFEESLTAMEMLNIATHSIFPPYLVSHLFGSLEIDIIIFVLGELRHRFIGDRVRLAWKLVEDLFTDHPELVEETSNTFYTALGNLTLEAWDARRKSTVLGFDDDPAEGGHYSPPAFIHALRDKRSNTAQREVPLAMSGPDAGMTEFDLFLNSGSWDWDYWTAFLQQ